MFYYLELPYGPEGNFKGGFLADSEGNLIDLNHNILTSLEDMQDILENDTFDEYSATSEGKLNGLLVVKIIDKEEVPAGEEAPEEELRNGET